MFRLSQTILMAIEKNESLLDVKTHILKMLKLRHGSYKNFKTRELDLEWCEKDSELQDWLSQNWENHPKYTIQEVFEMGNLYNRRVCFQYLPPSLLFKQLKAARRCVEGIDVSRRVYSPDGSYETVEKHNIYEVHQVKANELSGELEGDLFAVKCWCSSTTEEHWLWIDEKYKDDPLSAIASTFWMHENVIQANPVIQRQGDVMLVETDEQIIPEGNARPLTKEEYFGMLVAET